MNSDSLFESKFFHEHKGLITVLVTVGIAMITIIYLYFGLMSNERPVNTNPNNSNSQTSQNIGQVNSNNKKAIYKRRLTINAQDLLYKDLNDLDISFIYPILDSLSQAFDIYLIVLVDENEDLNKITDKFSVLIEDNLVLKHVSF